MILISTRIHTHVANSLKADGLSHHVLQVNEGVIDGHNLDAFLKTSPQDQTANTTEAVREEEREKGERGNC